MPKYAKIFKELRAKKKKLPENEKVSVVKNVFAFIQRKLPPKCNYRCMFAISYTISNVGSKKLLLIKEL